MDRYAARITLHGSSQRERELNRFKENQLKNAPSSLSYKKVELNGLITSLVIDSDDSNKYIKEIKSMPGESFETGDYVRWANATWLVTDADYDNEVYTDGKMQQCNWNLTYQKSNGEIVRYWCIDENSTQYNSGETSNKNMTLGSSQHMLKVQCNDDTVLIDAPQRLFLDKNLVNPTSFKVTQNDTTMYNYGKGLCCITLTQDEKKTDKDKLIELDSGEKVWIADYVEPAPFPSNPEGDKNDLLCRITGINKIRVGRSRTYMVEFVDTDGSRVDFNDYSWHIKSDFNDKITSRILKDSIEIEINDYTLIGNIFTINILTKDGIVLSSAEVTIIDLY